MEYFIGVGATLFFISIILSITAYRSYKKSTKKADEWESLYNELKIDYQHLDENSVYFTTACIEIQSFFSREENLDTPLERVSEMSGFDLTTVINVCNVLEDIGVIKFPNKYTKEEINDFLSEL